jgi:hypothetical protein
MDKIKHVIIRLFIHLLLILFFFSGGLSLLLLLPVYKAVFAPRSTYKELSFFPVWAHIYKMIWRSLTDKSYRDMFSSKITDPPILHNDLSKVQIKESWQGADDNCDACENSCCAQIKCPMLVDNRCLSYGSLFFGYCYCGRHPENQLQMDRYNCPKWEVVRCEEADIS